MGYISQNFCQQKWLGARIDNSVSGVMFDIKRSIEQRCVVVVCCFPGNLVRGFLDWMSLQLFMLHRKYILDRIVFPILQSQRSQKQNDTFYQESAKI